MDSARERLRAQETEDHAGPSLLHPFDKVEPLTAEERGDAGRERLINAIQHISQIADEAIPMLSRDGADCVIWSDLDEDECEALADALLAMASHNPAAAFMVRGMEQSSYMFEAGVITSRRLVKMLRYYVRHGLGINLRVMWARASVGDAP